LADRTSPDRVTNKPTQRRGKKKAQMVGGKPGEGGEASARVDRRGGPVWEGSTRHETRISWAEGGREDATVKAENSQSKRGQNENKMPSGKKKERDHDAGGNRRDLSRTRHNFGKTQKHGGGLRRTREARKKMRELTREGNQGD